MKKSMKVLLIVLSVLALLFLANLIIGILFPELYCYAGLIDEETLMDTEKLWAFRGQIGDILAGHFTALSLFALFYSLMLQRQSMEQMSESIKQQSQAITQQSTALINQQEEIALQNKALTAQVDEMGLQRDEFEANNLISQFQRYFKKIDELENAIQFKFRGGTQIHRGLEELKSQINSIHLIERELTAKMSALFHYCTFIAKQLDTKDDSKSVTKELKMEFALKLREMDFTKISNIYGKHLIAMYKDEDLNLLSLAILNLRGHTEQSQNVYSILDSLNNRFRHNLTSDQWQQEMFRFKFSATLFPEINAYVILENQ